MAKEKVESILKALRSDDRLLRRFAWSEASGLATGSKQLALAILDAILEEEEVPPEAIQAFQRATEWVESMAPDLLEDLEHGPESSRVTSIRLLEALWLGASRQRDQRRLRLLQPLLHALKDPAESVRGEACRALTYWSGEAAAEVVQPLIAMLSDPSLDVRGCALATLGSLGSGSLPAIGAIRDLARDTDPPTRATAIVTLVRLEGPGNRSDDLLVEGLADPWEEVRHLVLEALVPKRDLSVAVLAAVISRLEDPDDRCARLAIRVLEEQPALTEDLVEAIEAVARRGEGNSDTKLRQFARRMRNLR